MSTNNAITSFQVVSNNPISEPDDFTVEFEIGPAFEPKDLSDSQRVQINESLSEIDALSEKLSQKIEDLNGDIDRLTNHADGYDYAFAVTSGLITGMLDVLIVGKWDFKEAKAKSNKEINQKIEEFAKKQGYDGEKGLDGAVEFLEKKYKLPGDNDWDIKSAFVKQAKEKGYTPPDGKRGKYTDAVNYMNEHFPNKDGSSWGVKDNFITMETHHLDDLCHHPTLVGLVCNIIVQFTGKSMYSNKNSEFIQLPVTINNYGQFEGKNPVAKLFSGVINWFLNCARTMANAKGHWMSDLAGSKQSAGAGAGLPGSIMSLLKELSALPIFKDKKFAENLRKAYQNGIGTGKSQVDLGAFNALFEGASSKFDYRTENAIKGELKRQAMPVIINEVLVRSFYFIRRFIVEVKQADSLKNLNWKNVIPLNNRTIARMLTIATGTFTAVDLIDATVEGCLEGGAPIAGGVPNPAFIKEFILRVNFVGVGRFVVAVGTDVSMGIKKQKLVKERMKYQAEINMLSISRIYYQQEDMWIDALETETAINNLCQHAQKSLIFFAESWNEISGNLEKIQNVDIKKIKEKDSKLVEDLTDILRWG